MRYMKTQLQLVLALSLSTSVLGQTDTTKVTAKALESRVAPLYAQVELAIKESRWQSALNFLDTISREYKTANVPYGGDFNYRFDCYFGSRDWRKSVLIGEVNFGSLTPTRKLKLAQAFLEAGSQQKAMTIVPDDWFDKWGLPGVRAEFPNSLSNQDSKAWLFLALSVNQYYGGGKNRDTALDFSKEALRIRPNLPTGLYILGNSYKLVGKLKESKAVFQKLQRLDSPYKTEANKAAKSLEDALAKASSG
jgi:tetratricopeptide (TPR) repeat protein